VAIKEKQQLQA
jgi:hypothetical protein